MFANILISKANKYAHETLHYAAGSGRRSDEEEEGLAVEGLATFNHDDFRRIALLGVSLLSRLAKDYGPFRP